MLVCEEPALCALLSCVLAPLFLTLLSGAAQSEEGEMAKALLLGALALAAAAPGALAQMFGSLPMAPPRDSCP